MELPHYKLLLVLQLLWHSHRNHNYWGWDSQHTARVPRVIVTSMSGETFKILKLHLTVSATQQVCLKTFKSPPHPPTLARLWDADWPVSRTKVLCTGSRQLNRLLSRPLTTFQSKYQILHLHYLCKNLLLILILKQILNLNQVLFLILTMNLEILRFLPQYHLHH